MMLRARMRMLDRNDYFLRHHGVFGVVSFQGVSGSGFRSTRICIDDDERVEYVRICILLHTIHRDCTYCDGRYSLLLL